MRDTLDAWLRDGGTIRIVPAGAFAVAVLLGIIPMWLEFGPFPAWAPRDRIGTPLLGMWVVVFLATEVVRRSLARGATRRWETQWMVHERRRADALAGAIDRLCAWVLPQASGRLAPDHIQAALLQGIVDVVRTIAGVGDEAQLHAALLVPQARREGRRQVEYLQIVSTSRVVEGRGWASFRMDAQAPAQEAYGRGGMRTVPDTSADGVRTLFTTGAYRSIAAVPVGLRCLAGRRLAVVSIDASVAGVFTDMVAREMEQAIAPYVKLIALSLVMAD